MREEKRKSERRTVRFHLVYDDGASFNAGTVHDVSDGGLFLETALPLEVGTEVRLTPIDGHETNGFEVRARVVRTVPYSAGESEEPRFRGGMGLEFTNLDSDSRRNVMVMIEELEEKAQQQDGPVDPFLGVVVPNRQPDGEDSAT